MSYVLNYTAHSIIYHEKHVKEIKGGRSHRCGVKDSGNNRINDKEILNLSKAFDHKNMDQETFKLYGKIRRDAQQSHNRPRREAILAENRVSSRKLCSMYIRTDGMLWDAVQTEEFGNVRTRTEESDDKTRAKITELIHKHVKKLNLIMENTFFTDKINSLVFQIVKMDILEPEKPKCQPFCDRNLDSSPFLDVQSQADHSDFCLAYAFTYRDWTEGTLGVAWIAGLNQAGGICEDHKRASFVEGYRSRNTGVVTLKNSGRRIPIPKSELTFSHEVGHNLGSPHDEDASCLGSEEDGKFLMYPYSNSGNLKNHAKFSECSKKKIGVIFDQERRLDGCLEPFDGSFCGDGILDEGIFVFLYFSALS